MRELSNKYDKSRDAYRRLVRINIFLVCLALLMAIILTFQVFKPAKPHYYATTRQGDVVPMFALSQPLVTNEYVAQWASIAARKSFSFSFTDFYQQIQAITPYFTKDGMIAFKQALSSSGLANTIENKHLVVSAVVNGAVVTINQGVINGRYHWVLQLPVLLTYSSASDDKHKQMIVTMSISRVPTLDANMGIQITTLKARAKVSS